MIFNKLNNNSILKKLALSTFLIIVPASAIAEPSVERGKEVYNSMGACFSCHGALGKGDGPAGAALNPKPQDFSAGVFKFDTDSDGKTGSDIDLFNIITNGAQKYGGSPIMVGRADLPESDRQSIVLFIKSLKN